MSVEKTAAETYYEYENAKKLLDAWVLALRSGKYSQTKDVLRDEKGYCCLGILHEVRGGKWSSTVLETNGASQSCYTPLTADGFELSNAFSLTGSPFQGMEEDGTFTHKNGCQYSLSILNDEGTPFWKIADTIEENAAQIIGKYIE